MEPAAAVLSTCQNVLVNGWQDARSVIDFGTHATRFGGGIADDQYAPVLVVIFAILGFLGFVWIRARARVQEKRLDLIRELSAKGQLTPQTTADMLVSGFRLRSAVFVAAWFGLIGGASMVIVATVNKWRYDFEEIGVAGVAITVASFATLTAPMVLAELRRHTARS